MTSDETVETALEPTADVATEAGPVADTEAVTEAEPVADTEAVTEAEPVADTEPVAEAEPVAETETGTTDEPVSESAPPAEGEQVPETEQAAEVEAVAEPKPATPRPSPASVRPGPRPVPRPPVAAPTAPAAAAAAATAPAAPAAPVTPPVDAAEAALAATFGSVDEDGTVRVREASGERVVGQYPGATAEEALGLYVRRFLDLQAKITVFEARLTATDLSVKEIDQTLAKLTEETAEPAAVGDLDALRTRLEALRGVAAERRAQAEAERQAARAAAVEARTAIVEQAEKIAATDPSRIQWRPAGEQLRSLLDQWKDAQRSGPRLDRPTEESLWKRFSHARTTFDRERRHFFAELEQRNASAKQVKERLVAEAERLQSSTDWGATAGAFRDLMTEWKAAGRASRADDDALWARFRAAQDAFFAARDAENAATDAEYQANLQVKEALLTEAEALLPLGDLAAAKQAIRGIQDRWEAAGKVPRGDVQRVEGRLRAVESAIRDAEQRQWTRTNPETRARAEGAAAQLEQAIAGLEADLAKAEAAKDKRRIAEAQAALDARRAWLEQVQRAAHDARG
ncbi:DUF349 domain-containing protein [Cellulomonas sp. DKR-3]|uniref:DUF349 domain-containing protein n=1 Tax=Cellulomonas fulva TaxID=2835530 RepID=A0ABS5U0S5_9CELL|nr:DUF349 domain-containing protein [Cellulomonas fulva]